MTKIKPVITHVNNINKMAINRAKDMKRAVRDGNKIGRRAGQYYKSGNLNTYLLEAKSTNRQILRKFSHKDLLLLLGAAGFFSPLPFGCVAGYALGKGLSVIIGLLKNKTL